MLTRSFAQRQADAIGVVAECALASALDRGTAGDRYQVVVHVDADALTEEPDVPAGTSSLEGGSRRARQTSARCPGKGPATSTPSAPSARSQTVLDEAGGIHVSPETARRLACDAATVAMRHGPGGEILDVGRRTRTISPALRKALAARDRQCRFPGCQNRRCDAHHIRHWADGGGTALDNLVLVCRRHHRAVHEEGFRITLDATGDVRFVRPDGRPVPAAPPAPDWTGAPFAPVAARLDQDDISIGPNTATPGLARRTAGRWLGCRRAVAAAVGNSGDLMVVAADDSAWMRTRAPKPDCLSRDGVR